ncbi:hypothetical protein C8R48DRAFT_702220, partial [Suillus tomentosus]
PPGRRRPIRQFCVAVQVLLQSLCTQMTVQKLYRTNNGLLGGKHCNLALKYSGLLTPKIQACLDTERTEFRDSRGTA